jgi:hypothetical protein
MLFGVATGIGVDVRRPAVGVTGFGVGRGVSVVRGAGRLQDDTPMLAAMTTNQKRFLILSSFSK